MPAIADARLEDLPPEPAKPPEVNPAALTARAGSVTRTLPAPGTPVFLDISNFAIGRGSWHVDQHPRFVADITGDRLDEVAGSAMPGPGSARRSADQG